MSPYNIILVDDQTIFCEGLKLYLENELGHKVIAVAGNCKEFLELPNIYKADIIIMKIEMPIINGLEACEEITKQYFNLKIVATTMFQNKIYLKDLLAKGIKGFINNSNTFEDVQRVLDEVYENHFCFPDDIKLEKDMVSNEN